jgi:hypothetical protein
VVTSIARASVTMSSRAANHYMSMAFHWHWTACTLWTAEELTKPEYSIASCTQSQLCIVCLYHTGLSRHYIELGYCNGIPPSTPNSRCFPYVDRDTACTTCQRVRSRPCMHDLDPPHRSKQTTTKIYHAHACHQNGVLCCESECGVWCIQSNKDKQR